MARPQPQFGIAEAVPAARGVLGWHGWAFLALLVLPASIIAILVVADAAGSGNAAWTWSLAGVAFVALAACGFALRRLVAGLHRMTELAQAFSEHGGRPMFVKDTAHRYQFVNEELAALLGRGAVDIVGRRDRDLAPGPAARAYEENDRVCLDRGLPTMFRESLGAPGGERTFVVGKYPLHNGSGRVVGLVGVAQDVTDTLALQKLVRSRTDEMRAWFDRNPLPVVLFSERDQRLTGANAAALRCYGYDLPRMLSLHLPDLFAPAEHERLRTYLGNSGRAIPPGSLAWKHRRADGTVFQVLTDMGNLPHEPAGPGHVMLVRDVSDERAARAALQLSEARYEDLVESGLGVVWTQDFGGRLLQVNATMAEALGYSREDLLGHPLSEFIASDHHAEWTEYLARVRILPGDTGVLHLASRSGEQRVWQYRFTCYPEGQPSPYAVVVAQDVTVRHRYEQRIRSQAKRDPLTGCHTRAYLAVFALQATVDQAWGCITVDIDRFHQLNELEGRDRGDDVLRWLALLLASQMGPDAELVRIAGDGFAILLAHATADGLRGRAAALAALARGDAPAPFSVGWALREDAEPLESTLRRAEKMLLRGRAERNPEH